RSRRARPWYAANGRTGNCCGRPDPDPGGTTLSNPAPRAGSGVGGPGFGEHLAGFGEQLGQHLGLADHGHKLVSPPHARNAASTSPRYGTCPSVSGSSPAATGCRPPRYGVVPQPAVGSWT